MIYVFDPLAERVFFIELSEIITGKDLDKAVCTRKNGEAPQQTIDFDEQMNTNAALDLDENFYGDQDYDMEDLTRKVLTSTKEAEILMMKINIKKS